MNPLKRLSMEELCVQHNGLVTAGPVFAKSSSGMGEPCVGPATESWMSSVRLGLLGGGSLELANRFWAPLLIEAPAVAYGGNALSCARGAMGEKAIWELLTPWRGCVCCGAAGTLCHGLLLVELTRRGQHIHRRR